MRSVVRVHSCPFLILWSVGQGVKTPPFHGGNTGSNPVRTILYWRITQVRLKGTVLKTVRRVKACVGSNPTSSFCINAGWSSSVARRAHNPKVVGSNPAPAIFGSVAQLVEQWIEAPCVGGSIPSRAII